MNVSNESLDWLPTADVTVLQAALTYAEHGWRVIPVHGLADGRCLCGAPLGECSPGKHPIGRAWQKRASCDVDAVRDMFRAVPRETNIGLAMGEQGDGTYLVAFDIDGDRGRAQLAEHELALGPLPPTLTSASGRVDGGEHRLLIVGAGQDIRRLGNKARLGLDVRVRGGQIVVSPSLHASGARYQWTQRLPCAVLPDTWFESIAKPLPPPRAKVSASVHSIGNAYVEAVIKNMITDISTRREGERNHVLWAKTCTALEYCSGHHLPWDWALTRLTDAALQCGLPSREVDVTIKKAVSHVERTGAVRTAPPPERQWQASETPPGDGDAPASASRDWRERLMRDKGKVEPFAGNAIIILKNDPAWLGRLRYNTFAEQVDVTDPPWDDETTATGLTGTYKWSDADDVRLQSWLRRRYGATFSQTECWRAVDVVARAHSYHPIVEHLRTLRWDGTKRIDTWLHDHLGVTNSSYTREIARKFLISAVARAMKPGCQVDTMLILEGDQGLNKSSALRLLASEDWFLETQIDLRDTTAASVFRKKWLVEFAELASLRGADVDRLKGIITARVDTYRPPYGRAYVDFPRQCVLCASTNDGVYLRDTTGNRRFWPVWCTFINLATLARDRDQLWAEAVAAYDAGEVWYIVDEKLLREAEAEQSARLALDPWEETITAYCARPGKESNGVTTSMIMGEALAIETGRRTRADEMRIGSVLRRLGWARRRARVGEALFYLYFPKARTEVGT